MTEHVPQASKRMQSIDMLRGIAALAVVLHHAINYRPLPENASLAFVALRWILNWGHLGVPLFFVLSGFCIHQRWAMVYQNDEKARLDYWAFWKRRVMRLYPTYFVALLISMGIMVVGYCMGLSSPMISSYPEPKLRWMSYDFVAHALMLHGLHPRFDAAGGNPPFWTLAREEYLYALYCLIIPLRRRWGVYPILAGVLIAGLIFPIAFVGRVAAGSLWWDTINNSAVVLWIQWCLGMLAVEAYVGITRLPRMAYSGWWASAWAMMAMACTHRWDRATPVLWGMCFFTLLNWILQKERDGKLIDGWLTRWFAGVGVFSYSLYLAHYPMRGLTKHAMTRMGIPEAGGDLWHLAYALILSVACYYSGKLLFYSVERHFLFTSKKVAT